MSWVAPLPRIHTLRLRLVRLHTFPSLRLPPSRKASRRGGPGRAGGLLSLAVNPSLCSESARAESLVISSDNLISYNNCHGGPQTPSVTRKVIACVTDKAIDFKNSPPDDPASY